MQKLILTVGIPACGKSTWAKEEIRKDPEGTSRVNRDDLRNMMSNYTFTDSNEKLVTGVRDFAITHALKRGRNVIVDETNLNPRNWGDMCKLVKNLNIDCMIMEKPFYIELEEALERDSKRAGSGNVGEEIVKKFWKKSGGKQHKHYKPKVEVFYKNQGACVDLSQTIIQDESLPKAIICDLDGTLALMGKRSPYDASNCDEVDLPNKPVIETVKMFYDSGYRIFFCSGREDKDEAPSRRFIAAHLPGIHFELFMRKTGDQRKDSIVKDEIFNENFKDKYYIMLLLDDRNQVVEHYREMGLTVFQVAPGDF
jgi:predicted kinase